MFYFVSRTCNHSLIYLLTSAVDVA